MKKLTEHGLNEWIVEQTEPNELTTHIKVFQANDPDYDEGYIKEKDMLVGFLGDEEGGIIMDVEEQLLLRDLLNKLHGHEITVQKDY